MIRNLALFLLVVSLLVPSLAAAETGFQFAVPDRNFPEDEAVNGMRMSIFWGNNRRTEGFDLGLVSISQTEVRSGFAMIWGVSRVTGKSDGAANLSFVNYHTGSDSGLNAAFVNLVHDTRNGFNLGFIQIASGETAVDLGGVNVSKKSKAQIGFINITEQIEGFQLGFINMADNGFFPIFPFFNYAKKADR